METSQRGNHLHAPQSSDSWLLDVSHPFALESLFDQLDDVVFFIKNRAGCYTAINTTLMQRCGFRHKGQMIGRSPLDVFPPELGARYAAQDRFVLESGQRIHNQLELHLYPDRAPGWCLTHKIPLLDSHGGIIGLAGISQDIRVRDREGSAYRRIANVVAYMQKHYTAPLRLPDLAAMANLSVAQFERYIQRIFHLTPKQLIMKIRLDAAVQLLEGDSGIAEIAHACGYSDHSAFSRQFKAIVGITPSEYRDLHKMSAN